jgi:hypothetical protein
LLCSQETLEGAVFCRDWLHDVYNFPSDRVQIQQISPALSEDPINLELAVSEAQAALVQTQNLLDRGEANWIDFNASSGTPTMKQTWGILQASGYAINSTVWQVRDPNFIKEGQERVFSSDLSRLKAELDLKVLRQQVERYDYAGALDYLPLTQFKDDHTLHELLEYGRTRLALDAGSAYRNSTKLSQVLDESSKNSIEGLKEEKPAYILQELYWQTQIARKNQNYASALVFGSAFLEHASRFEIKRRLGLPEPQWNSQWNNISSEVVEKIKCYDDGQIYRNLEEKTKSALDKRYPRFDRGVYQDILGNLGLQFDRHWTMLDKLAKIRNNYIHEMKGVADLRVSSIGQSSQDSMESILRAMKSILIAINWSVPKSSAFDILNQILLDRMQVAI